MNSESSDDSLKLNASFLMRFYHKIQNIDMYAKGTYQGFCSYRLAICSSVPVSIQKSTGYRVQRNLAERRQREVCHSDFNSDLLGPSLNSTPTELDESEVPLEEAVNAIELKSAVSMDYSNLKEYLRSHEFQKADNETRAIIIRLAGEEAEERTWVYFTEVPGIPTVDLITIDSLWKAASNGKFGYSVQKRIFYQNMKRWTKFFKAIDWTVGEDNAYRKWPAEFIYSLEAKDGHLPLTNCLRGTQLFEQIMNHEAFATNDNDSDKTSNDNKWTSHFDV